MYILIKISLLVISIKRFDSAKESGKPIGCAVRVKSNKVDHICIETSFAFHYKFEVKSSAAIKTKNVSFFIHMVKLKRSKH